MKFMNACLQEKILILMTEVLNIFTRGWDMCFSEIKVRRERDMLNEGRCFTVKGVTMQVGKSCTPPNYLRCSDIALTCHARFDQSRELIDERDKSTGRTATIGVNHPTHVKQLVPGRRIGKGELFKLC